MTVTAPRLKAARRPRRLGTPLGWLAGLLLAIGAGPALAQAAADASAPACQVALPAACEAPNAAAALAKGDSVAPPRQRLTVDADTADACLAGARAAAAACLQSSGGKATVRARFLNGPVDTVLPVLPARLATPTGPLALPIVYGKAFETETELFGYAPGFAPGTVNIGPDGLARIRHKQYLQTQTRQGGWTFRNLAAQAEQAIRRLPDVAAFEWVWDNRSSASDARIYTDAQGRSYTLVQGSRTRLKQAGQAEGGKAVSYRLYLLATADDGASWQAVAIEPPDAKASWRARLEHNDDNSDRSDPPPVLLYDRDDDPARRSQQLLLFLPRWRGDQLGMAPPVRVSDKSLLQENHSGAGNSVVSTRDKVFVVYPGATSLPDQPGTPAYAVTVDKKTGAVDAEALLGFGGTAAKVDNHNIPAICVGHDKTLQVVLTGHQEGLKALSGKLAGGKVAWSAPVDIGQPASGAGGYTYASLNCDRRGHVYLTSRWSGDQYRFKLVFMHRQPDGQWSQWNGLKHRVIVDPGRPFYAVWRQRLTLGKAPDELFLAYSYYANQLSKDEQGSLRSRLEFEDWAVVKQPAQGLCVKGEDPRCWLHPMPDVNKVLLRSVDGGNQWTLVR